MKLIEPKSAAEIVTYEMVAAALGAWGGRPKKTRAHEAMRLALVAAVEVAIETNRICGARP